MLDASKKALEKAGLTIDDIACIIPHQANIRIIEAIADRLKLPLDSSSSTSTATATPPPPPSPSRSMKPIAPAGSSRAITS